MGQLAPAPRGGFHLGWGATITRLEQRGYGWPSVTKSPGF